MIEVEIKYRLECYKLPEFEEKLRKAGFTPVEERYEEDLYFNSPVRDFKQSDEALRLRKEVNGKERVKLTYKGKKIDSRTKTREEITVRVDSFEGAKTILERLGFKPVMYVKKRRKIYEKNGISVCLDRVEKLGCFVEFETILENRESLKQAVECLESLARGLGIEGKSITKSYLEMLI